MEALVPIIGAGDIGNESGSIVKRTASFSTLAGSPSPSNYLIPLEPRDDGSTSQSSAKRPSPCGSECAACVAAPISSATSIATEATPNPRKEEKAAIAKRALNTPDEFKNHGGIDGFMNALIDMAGQMRNLVAHLGTYNGKRLSAGLWAPFEDAGDLLGANDIYGCTVAIVISRRGVWLVHLWEVGGFLKDPKTWDTETDWWKEATDSEYGKTVLDPINYKELPSVPVLREFTAGSDNLFAPNTKTKSMIVTPKHPDKDEPLYQKKVDMLQRVLHGHLNRVSEVPEVVLYDAARPGGKDEGWSDEDIRKLKKSAKGKIAIQYDPSESEECGEQIVRLRVWVQDKPTPVYEDSWQAMGNQKWEN